MNPRTDPACLALLADLRALAKRAAVLSKRCDRESHAAGKLWGVTRGIDEALACAESEIGQADE